MEEVVAREGFRVCLCGEVGLLVGCVFFFLFLYCDVVFRGVGLFGEMGEKGKGEREGKGKEGMVEKLGRTLRVVLQDVDVAVCVPDGYVELSVRREEGGCYHFDCVG